LPRPEDRARCHPGRKPLLYDQDGAKTSWVLRQRRPIPVARVSGLRIVVTTPDRAAAVA
jgi:hypothetical protein